MSKKLKEYLDHSAVRSIAGRIKRVYNDFPAREFHEYASTGLDDLELFARVDHIAGALRHFLIGEFSETVTILKTSLGPARQEEGYGSYENLVVLPLTRFISRYGISEPHISLPALAEMTRRFTAEWDIRPFILNHSATTLKFLHAWTGHPDLHVRRLVSEGTRTRLPWAKHLRMFIDDPRPVFALLERLKHDKSQYVQVSVANNMADIIKDNPDAAYEVLLTWTKSGSPQTKAIITRALRKRVQSCRRAQDIMDKLTAH